MFYKNIIDAIGNTPLVQMALQTPATVLAKLEYLNPGGSVKDRSALYLVEQAEKDGRLKPGGTIVDASSGNHGIALAMVGALKGYKVIITVSEKISKEKMQTLKAYGAEIVICPATAFIDDPRSYHMQAKEILRKIPNAFMPNQYFNTENRDAHYSLLGPEIWKQTEGKITHFFAGAGTGGTVSGVGRFLKEKNPAIKVYGLDSNNSFRATKGNPKPYRLEGLGVDFVSEVLDYNVIDEILTVTDDEAIGMMNLFGRTHGVLVGPSSGAVAAGVHQKLSSFKEGDVIVMIFGDSGRAYLSKNFFSQDELPFPQVQGAIHIQDDHS